MPRPKPFRRPDGSRTTPRTVFERISERISNEPPDSPPTERFSNHPLGQIPDCRPNLFRAPSRRSFRLPFGGDSAPPSGQIPDRFPEEFQVVIPDRFQVAGRIPNRHPYEPQLGPPPRKSHRKAGGIPGGATCGRNRLIRTSGSAAPPTCIRLSAPAPRRTRTRK